MLGEFVQKYANCAKLCLITADVHLPFDLQFIKGRCVRACVRARVPYDSAKFVPSRYGAEDGERSVAWYSLCARAGDCYSMMRVRLVVAEKVAASLINTQLASSNPEQRRRVH